MFDHTWKQDADELARSCALSVADDQTPSDVPQVPGYKITEKLGQGQYGSVWKAVDLNARIPVAIKVFRQTGGLDYALLHGEVEKLIALCEDQRVVGLRQVGWDADPPYFVMDYLENSLEKRLRQGPLSIDEATTMFDRIMGGLVHAHNKGILHCDLKPGNILLDHDGEPRIADFGQSRLSTQHTPALGTLFYMAPEQADLKGVPDARWDVYAAGAVLYCMLTGAAPYQSDEIRKQLSEADTPSSVLARYRQIILESPKPTDHHRVPGIDRSLIEIIDRCLDKDSRRRYANAQALREALHLRSRWLRQKPVLALGIVLPLMFLILMAGAFWHLTARARNQATLDMVAAARDSSRSFAAAVTGSTARQFDRRWRSLTTLAEKSDFRESLTQWSQAAAELRSRGAVPGTGPTTDELPGAQKLDQMARQFLVAEFQGTGGIAWFVLDAEGYMAAFAAQRQSAASFVGRRFNQRDYYRGVIENPTGPDVYVSRPFHPSQPSGDPERHHVLVFSVPVYDRDLTPFGPKPRLIGVVAMAVPIGGFAELQFPNLETTEARDRLDKERDWIPQIATLVDTRPVTEVQRDAAESDGPSGLVLHHAYYRLYGGERYQDRYEDFPQAFLPARAAAVLSQTVSRATSVLDSFSGRIKAADEAADPQREKRKLRNQWNEKLAELYADQEPEFEASFSDPMGDSDRRFAPPDAAGWILAVRPVVVLRPGKAVPMQTGLMVLVQQRRDVVIRSALKMSSGMLRRATVLFGVAALLMLSVWFYGFTLLNPTSQSRLTRAIWRFTGVRTARSTRASQGTGWSTRSGPAAKTADSQ